METKYKIFIVDDNPFNLLLISRKLKKSINCTTRLFQNATECIRTLDKEVPDLVLTDYRLTDNQSQKMDGEYVLNWFKGHHATIPVVLYSSIRNFDLVVKLIHKGAADFVAKDENFLKKIAMIAGYQLRRLSSIAAEKKTRRIILTTIVAVCAIMYYLSFMHQELLVPFAVILLLVFAAIVFLKDLVKKYVYWI